MAEDTPKQPPKQQQADQAKQPEPQPNLEAIMREAYERGKADGKAQAEEEFARRNKPALFTAAKRLVDAQYADLSDEQIAKAFDSLEAEYEGERLILSDRNLLLNRARTLRQAKVVRDQLAPPFRRRTVHDQAGERTLASANDPAGETTYLTAS